MAALVVISKETVALFFLAIVAWVYFVDISDDPILNGVSDKGLSNEIRAWEAAGEFLDVFGLRVWAAIHKGERKSHACHKGSPGPCLDGRTILLVHGFPSSSFDYHRVTPLFTALGADVVVFDLPGFGLSEKPTKGGGAGAFGYSLGEQAEVTLGVWRQLGVQEGHVVAHDMGDSVVTEILSRLDRGVVPTPPFPRLNSVTFTNGGMQVEQIAFRLSQRLLLNPWIAPLVLRLNTLRVADGAARQQLASIWGRGRAREHMEEDITDMLSLVRHNNGRTRLHWAILYLWDRYQFEPRWMRSLTRLNLPTFLFWGDADAVSPLSIPSSVFRRVTGVEEEHASFHVGRPSPPSRVSQGRGTVQMQVAEGMGHFGMLESPEAWVGAVGGWLASLP